MYLCTEKAEGQEPRAAVQKSEILETFLKVKNDCQMSLLSKVIPRVFGALTKMPWL